MASMGDRAADAPNSPAAPGHAQRPSIGRMYDYLLGGVHHTSTDRAAADRALAQMPDLASVLRANRAFLGRAVRRLAGCGLRQFLDLGSGIPTGGATHEVAHRVDRGIRVVYVDLDPTVVLVGERVLADAPTAAILAADLRHPELVLRHRTTGRLLDLDQPVAVLLVAVLHLLSDDDAPATLIATLFDLLAPGSALIVSSMAPPERQTPAGMRQAQETYASSGHPLYPRTREQLEMLLGGWQLQPPGLVACPHWHPDPQTDPLDPATTYPGTAGVAVKPPPRPTAQGRPAGAPAATRPPPPRAAI